MQSFHPLLPACHIFYFFSFFCIKGFAIFLKVLLIFQNIFFLFCIIIVSHSYFNLMKVCIQKLRMLVFSFCINYLVHYEHAAIIEIARLVCLCVLISLMGTTHIKFPQLELAQFITNYNNIYLIFILKIIKFLFINMQLLLAKWRSIFLVLLCEKINSYCCITAHAKYSCKCELKKSILILRHEHAFNL